MYLSLIKKIKDHIDINDRIRSAPIYNKVSFTFSSPVKIELPYQVTETKYLKVLISGPWDVFYYLKQIKVHEKLIQKESNTNIITNSKGYIVYTSTVYEVNEKYNDCIISGYVMNGNEKGLKTNKILEDFIMNKNKDLRLKLVRNDLYENHKNYISLDNLDYTTLFSSCLLDYDIQVIKIAVDVDYNTISNTIVAQNSNNISNTTIQCSNGNAIARYSNGDINQYVRVKNGIIARGDIVARNDSAILDDSIQNVITEDKSLYNGTISIIEDNIVYSDYSLIDWSNVIAYRLISKDICI